VSNKLEVFRISIHYCFWESESGLRLWTISLLHTFWEVIHLLILFSSWFKLIYRTPAGSGSWSEHWQSCLIAWVPFTEVQTNSLVVDIVVWRIFLRMIKCLASDFLLLQCYFYVTLCNWRLSRTGTFLWYPVPLFFVPVAGIFWGRGLRHRTLRTNVYVCGTSYFGCHVISSTLKVDRLVFNQFR
jgi:hypothetical protein